jgi:hypothetical protein
LLRLLKCYFSYRTDFAEVSIGYCGEKGARSSPRSAYSEQENSHPSECLQSQSAHIALTEAACLERTTWPGRGFSESCYSRSGSKACLPSPFCRIVLAEGRAACAGARYDLRRHGGCGWHGRWAGLGIAHPRGFGRLARSLASGPRDPVPAPGGLYFLAFRMAGQLAMSSMVGAAPSSAGAITSIVSPSALEVMFQLLWRVMPPSIA